MAHRAIRYGLIEAFQVKFGFFSTFGGNPVAAAAALAVLEVLDREQLMANAQVTGDYLRRQLSAAANGTRVWAGCAGPGCCWVSRFKGRTCTPPRSAR
jgi:4-aminobutyrate aminotransferase-like enzyme